MIRTYEIRPMPDDATVPGSNGVYGTVKEHPGPSI